MENIGTNSSSVMFLFTSPQYLADNKVFLNAVLAAHYNVRLGYSSSGLFGLERREMKFEYLNSIILKLG